MDDFTLVVQRTSGSDDSISKQDEFSVPVIAESMSFLDALLWARSNQDDSLAFRRACRVGMYGTCGVRINGRERLACKTLVNNELGAHDGPIRVEPLRHLPLIKDLVTDPGIFFQRLTKVSPQMSPAAPDQQPVVILPDSKERLTIAPHRECIYCGLCYSACSMVGPEREFVGPAALNRAFALVSDSRDGQKNQRLTAIDGAQGVWNCHTIFECTATCPKDIPITHAIQGLKRKVFLEKFKSLFGFRKDA